MTNDMTPEEQYRFSIYEQVQQARADAGRIMKTIVDINAQETHTEGEEQIRNELLGFASQLLETYNNSTSRLLQKWEELNP